MIKKISLWFIVIVTFAAGGFYVTHTPFPNTPARDATGKKLYAQNGPATVTYYVSGSGSRVILLASAGREISDFNELIKHINLAGYQTLAIEAPGINGTSMPSTRDYYAVAEQVKAVIDLDTRANGQGPIVVIGHAYGNRIARTVASQYPSDIKGAILLAAGGQKPIDPIADKALKDIFNPLHSTRKRMTDIRLAFFAGDNKIPDYWRRGWHTKTAIFQGQTVANTKDNEWQAGGVGPMLVIQAMDDTIAPKADTADLLKASYPDRVTVVTIDDAGHALLPEQPEAISQAVLEFLAEHHPIGAYK